MFKQSLILKNHPQHMYSIKSRNNKLKLIYRIGVSQNDKSKLINLYIFEFEQESILNLVNVF